MNTITEKSNIPRVVIVGGGFGGLHAARGLGHSPVNVTLIDRNNHHVFQPLLYQVATAGLSPADIAAPIRGMLHAYRNIEVMMGEVVGVDTVSRKVMLTDGEVAYDYLILAAGSRHSYFGHDSWEAYAPGLKQLSDATDIRRRILLAFERAETEPDAERRRALLTFVLVGAGPTGVEMAGAIAELAHTALASDFRHIDPRSARILLLEAGPRILATFAEDLAEKARLALTELGVEVQCGKAVEDVDAQGVVVGGDRIDAGSVIWTAGVEASPAGKWLGAETDRAGRVFVEKNLSAPGMPNVFVIGDGMTLERQGVKLPGLAPVAMQQGDYVAKVIRTRIQGMVTPPPFKYLDKGSLATVGRAFAVLDVHGFKMAGFFAWIAWLTIHIFYLIGFRNRLVVLIQWAWAYLTFQRGARLIVRDRVPAPQVPAPRRA